MQVRDLFSSEAIELLEQMVYIIRHEEPEAAVDHMKTILKNDHILEEDE